MGISLLTSDNPKLIIVNEGQYYLPIMRNSQLQTFQRFQFSLEHSEIRDKDRDQRRPDQYCKPFPYPLRRVLGKKERRNRSLNQFTGVLQEVAESENAPTSIIRKRRSSRLSSISQSASLSSSVSHIGAPSYLLPVPTTHATTT